MAEIIKRRIIRPSTRLESSKNYKIDTTQVYHADILIVHITHESKSFKKTYRFNGKDVASKRSISFRVKDYGTSIEISWSGAQPSGKVSKVTSRTIHKTIVRAKDKSAKSFVAGVSNLKTSFAPISNPKTRILILGTMPGDRSLSLNEYYGNPRNNFWKIISVITNTTLPVTYQEKIKLLHLNKIGIWDVANKGIRKGSLDVAIEDEKPNDLNTFISQHKKLRVIAFNGTKSEALYNKYFIRKTGIKYLLLPSTSSANTNINVNNICKVWKKIFIS